MSCLLKEKRERSVPSREKWEIGSSRQTTGAHGDSRHVLTGPINIHDEMIQDNIPTDFSSTEKEAMDDADENNASSGKLRGNNYSPYRIARTY